LRTTANKSKPILQQFALADKHLCVKGLETASLNFEKGKWIDSRGSIKDKLKKKSALLAAA